MSAALRVALDPASAWGLSLLRARGPLVRDVHTWRNGDMSTHWIWNLPSVGAIGFGACVATVLVDHGFARIDGDRIFATAAAGVVALPPIPPAMPPALGRGWAP